MNRSVVSAPGRSKTTSYPSRNASGAGHDGGADGAIRRLGGSWQADGEGGAGGDGNNWVCTSDRSAEPATCFRAKNRSDKICPAPSAAAIPAVGFSRQNRSRPESTGPIINQAV